MITLTNGKILTITGPVYERGTVLTDGGSIRAVGEQVAIPADADVVDLHGAWVLPGLIDAHTHMSNFPEPGTTPGLCRDVNEHSDPIMPHVQAADAINPWDYAIEPVRQAGFTTVCTLPGSANVCGGMGIVWKLMGHTAEEMILPGTEQMKFAVGENPKKSFGMKDKLPITRMGLAALLRQTLSDACAYSDALLAVGDDPSKLSKRDHKLQALVPVVRGEMFCRFHAHRADDICTVIRIAREFGLRYSIEHATEGYKIVDVLRDSGVTCVVGPHLLAPAKQETQGISLRNAAVLSDAGVPICLTANGGSMTQYLPATAGILIARGLQEEAAFRALTIQPARLLGIADRVGSIEVGKDADLAVFSGHLFNSMNRCLLTMINGIICHRSL